MAPENSIKTCRVSEHLYLRYEEYGAGVLTLLFIHGLGSNKKAWRKNVEDLAKSFHCIAVDLPGYGQSSQEAYDFSMDFFSQVLGDFVEKKKWKRVVVVGHSMGGQIAVHLAMGNPDWLAKLILIAPAGFEKFSRKEGDFLLSICEPKVIMAFDETRIRLNFEVNFHDMPEDARFMIEDRLKMKETPEYEYFSRLFPKCVKAMLDKPILDLLPKLKKETLILFGADDQLIPSQILHPTLNVADIANVGHQLIPQSQLVLIPHCGHFVQWEQSGRVNLEIRKFLH